MDRRAANRAVADVVIFSVAVLLLIAVLVVMSWNSG